MEYIWCPVCRSEPERGPQWQCLPVCGMEWDTFDTAGICPACGECFEYTQCNVCGEFSPHPDWYHSRDPRETAAREKALVKVD